MSVALVATAHRPRRGRRPLCGRAFSLARLRPSKANGLVTTATVRMPSSLATEATIGAEPVPEKKLERLRPFVRVR